VWPGVTQLKDFKPTFPKWTGGQLDSLCMKISEEGKDLLKQLLIYDPNERITPEEALDHPYFNSLDKNSFASRNYS